MYNSQSSGLWQKKAASDPRSWFAQGYTVNEETGKEASGACAPSSGRQQNEYQSLPSGGGPVHSSYELTGSAEKCHSHSLEHPVYSTYNSLPTKSQKFPSDLSYSSLPTNAHQNQERTSSDPQSWFAPGVLASQDNLSGITSGLSYQPSGGQQQNWSHYPPSDTSTSQLTNLNTKQPDQYHNSATASTVPYTLDQPQLNSANPKHQNSCSGSIPTYTNLPQNGHNCGQNLEFPLDIKVGRGEAAQCARTHEYSGYDNRGSASAYLNNPSNLSENLHHKLHINPASSGHPHEPQPLTSTSATYHHHHHHPHPLHHHPLHHHNHHHHHVQHPGSTLCEAVQESSALKSRSQPTQPPSSQKHIPSNVSCNEGVEMPPKPQDVGYDLGPESTKKTSMSRQNYDICPTDIRQTDSAAACSSSSVFEYDFTHPCRGTAIIINNMNFSPATYQRGRTGAALDSNHLEETFQLLGFKVRSYLNLSYLQMMMALNEVAREDHSKNDCLVCVISSHGDQDLIKTSKYSHKMEYTDLVYATDGILYVNVITSMFDERSCPSLAGKPKLFFIQACRGSSLSETVEVADGVGDSVDDTDWGNHSLITQNIPIYCDGLVAYSCPPGFFSFRRSTGSWFITTLCEILQTCHGDVELEDMLRLVSHKVAYEFQSNTPGVENQRTHRRRVVPSIMSMLRGPVWFRPKTAETQRIVFV